MTLQEQQTYIFRAFCDGKQIEYKCHGRTLWEIRNPNCDFWDFSTYEYRIASERKTRPMNRDELIKKAYLGGVTSCGSWFPIDRITCNNITVSGINYTFDDFARNFTQPNGEPFVVTE